MVVVSKLASEVANGLVGSRDSVTPVVLTGYTDSQLSKVCGIYNLMLNPKELKWERRVTDHDLEVPNTGGSDPEIQCPLELKLSFDFVIDTTGIVDLDRLDCMAEIKSLENVLYDESSLLPNFVTVSWGADIAFHGKLSSFDSCFTLFKPDGSPLRAKVSLAFSNVAPTELTQKESNESPDTLTEWM